MRPYLLDLDHPYVRNFKPEIVTIGENIYVRWRDFDSVKQEANFSCAIDASRYARLLEETCCLIDLDYYETRFYDANKFWYSA
jgi:hypothetical protein